MSEKGNKEWFSKFKKPLIVAGPCSAESEEQVLATAKELAKIEAVQVFRAGIWKPRTRPNSFEGVGAIGLQWLKKVKEQTGLLTAVEAANAQHVEECLKAGIDIIWIGARTTVNPFTVQEIADALKGVDITVMVKNPINPDLQLWLGAIERLNNVGIDKVIAVHRGFSSLSQTKFRNSPNWQIPIELKIQMPHIPVICDPSHIAGNRELLLSVAQEALDLDMDGLMIETHIDPTNAKSDAQQQITPAKLKELLSQLVFRSPVSGNVEFSNRLEQLRKRIDKIDLDIVDILAARMQLVEEIGLYKKENNVTILQLERWNTVLKNILAQSENLGMDKEFSKKLYQLVHEESIRIQTKIMNRELHKK
jgi:chorismate mutase